MTEAKRGRAPRHITEKDKGDIEVTQQVDLGAAAVADEITTEQQAVIAQAQHIMDTYGDGQLYERNRVITETRFYMGQSAEAMLEAGKRLIVLKENEAHGDFAHILEDQLGLAVRTAQQMMQASMKYLSPKLKPNARALAHLGKTKLLDLMTEDDDAIAGLAVGGTIAGLTLDKIDTMSSRELKAALRESHQKLEDKEAVIINKNKKIDDQSEQILRIRKYSNEEIAEHVRTEANRMADEVEALIRLQLKDAFTSVQLQGDVKGVNTTDYLSSRLDLLDKALLYVRGVVGIERGVELSNTPEWESAQQ